MTQPASRRLVTEEKLATIQTAIAEDPANPGLYTYGPGAQGEFVGLAPVATSGAYGDLIGGPYLIPRVADWFIGQFGRGNATRALTLNELWFTPILVPMKMSVDGIRFSVDAAATGALVRSGLYRANTNNRPGQLVFDAGTADGSTTGNKLVTVTAVALNPGLYYTAVANQGTAAASIRVYQTDTGGPYNAPGQAHFNSIVPGENAFMLSGATGVLPTTGPAETTWADSRTPIVGLRRSA